ncbi:malonyl-CoA decarboxylase, mitochondrial-like isoform X2 [Xenia sp. Carnegie-2017]|uniref:malonyl-CoA decarboxylase, mitochondrial-like isoform X2 n=1 Tax=Xenia sp. Carnegie-2017 TaxID=2897299 RepID=UPI001F0416E7|nr:malonyl-CoA decarboxylase, mitochondrial-like isoform X2 [Xenia sp. Carnegie-2017]
MNWKLVRFIFFKLPTHQTSRYFNRGNVLPSLWSHFLSKEGHAKTSNDKTSDDHMTVRQMRDVLLQSKLKRKSIGSKDILPENLATDFVSFYKKIETKVEKLKLFNLLARDFGIDHQLIADIAENLKSTKNHDINSCLELEEQLQNSLEPPSIVLLSYIGHLEGGVKFIVDLRSDLLELLSDRDVRGKGAELNGLNQSIRHLLSMWFSVGFLKLERITWQSPCDITEKVGNYEAVHQVRNWMDMKKRIGPYRRCYVFMHPSMPREPVCVLHIALRDEIPSDIKTILSEDVPNHEEDIERKTTAVFYSVSSTQKGLAEIDLGNSLIKEAVKELRHDAPDVSTFVTLSPIPGFYRWFQSGMFQNSESSLISRIMDHESLTTEDKLTLEQFVKPPFDLNFKNFIDSPFWLRNNKIGELLKVPLMEICADYLYNEKKQGFAYDPVANFHLRNGAVLWRLNWKADVSRNGALSSLGMMVNYKYELNDLDENTRQYFLRGTVPVSAEFLKHLPQ